jgi:hypothetical protein
VAGLVCNLYNVFSDLGPRAADYTVDEGANQERQSNEKSRQTGEDGEASHN